MTPIGDDLTIGRLANAANVNVETIRFYQRKGLIPEPARPVGGIRRYGPTDIVRVRFIKSAQRLGFNLNDVGQLLQLDVGMQCHAAAQVASAHLAGVRARLNDLGRIESALSRLLKRCSRRRGAVTCPLIAALRADDGHWTGGWLRSFQFRPNRFDGRQCAWRTQSLLDHRHRR